MAGRKLKVFQAQFGFYDTVVAAPSQAAALQAWGTHQNLFASGDAKTTMDEAAVAAALQHPETPLRRAVGSTDPFVLEPAKLPEIKGGPKKPAKRSTKSKRSTPAKPPADRSKLDAAEQALHALEEHRKREAADFRREQDALEVRRDAADDAYAEARKTAKATVEAARASYRKAGGAK